MADNEQELKSNFIVTPHHLGVDVAGVKNTWVCNLFIRDQKKPSNKVEKWHAIIYKEENLETILLQSEIEKQNNSEKKLPSMNPNQKDGTESLPKTLPQSLTIDAPLNWRPEESSGTRVSDKYLQDLLKKENKENWVMSANSMKAVPLRGQNLAQLASPLIGSIIETHPRVNLNIMYYQNINSRNYDPVILYKKAEKHKEKMVALHALFDKWISCFFSQTEPPIDKSKLEFDGQLDALVCATIGMLFHSEPSTLRQLNCFPPRKNSINKPVAERKSPDSETSADTKTRGHGPFIILNDQANFDITKILKSNGQGVGSRKRILTVQFGLI